MAINNTVSNPGEYQDAVPIAKLGIIAMPGCERMGQEIDNFITGWRKEHAKALPKEDIRHQFVKDSYLIEAHFPRFSTGEGKGVIGQSVRGYDLFLLCDCFNWGVTYDMYGQERRTSPDEHFANLKRVISAAAGKESRLNVIMPMLYEGRQHRRSNRESLDCAMALQELVSLGVRNIITFDAHDPRVQNAIPTCGFESVPPTHQMIKAILQHVPDIKIDNNHLMVISPDEGAMTRSIFYAHMLGVDLGMFYKRRDYSIIKDGRNPIIAHEFLGANVAGKDVIIVDDMISSGDSIIDVCRQLKSLGAQRVFACVAFGLFSSGLERMDDAYARGSFDKIFTGDMVFTPPDLQEREWHISVPMSKYIAFLIDTLNHEMTISRLLTPTDRIQRLLKQHGVEVKR